MADLAPEPATLRLALTEEQRRHVADVSDSLRALAKQIAARYRFDADDLHQRALEIACRRVVDYDPSAGAFLTYIYERVWHALAQMCSREKRARLIQANVARGAAKVAEKISYGDTADDLAQDREEVFRQAQVGEAVSAILAYYADPTTPEEAVLTADQHAHLRKRVDAALATLDAIDRQIVVRHAIDDLTLAAVQRELGIESYREVRKRWLDAAGRLAKRLKRAVR